MIPSRSIAFDLPAPQRYAAAPPLPTSPAPAKASKPRKPRKAAKTAHDTASDPAPKPRKRKTTPA